MQKEKKKKMRKRTTKTGDQIVVGKPGKTSKWGESMSILSESFLLLTCTQPEGKSCLLWLNNPRRKKKKKKQKIMSGEKGGDLQLLLCSANIVRIVCHSCLRKEGNFSNSRWGGGGGEKLFLMAGGRKKKKGQHSKLISTFQESSVTQV